MYEPNLLAWQWSLYPENHRSRANLMVHIVAVPLFIAGTLEIVIAPIAGHPWFALAGPVAMAVSMAAQGHGHRQEVVPPVPFGGPLDAISRIFVEQLITFPRFVLTGGFASRVAGCEDSLKRAARSD